MLRKQCVAVIAIVSLVGGLGIVLAVSPASAASAAPARFVPVSPDRLLDTRSSSIVASGGGVDFAVTERNGVPASASAVVLNLTATASGGAGYVAAYPFGSTQPTASNLNIPGPGFTLANLVTVRVGSGGRVRLFSSIETHLIADIFGYYEPSGATSAGRFIPVGPDRTLDTRSDGGRLAAGSSRRVTLRGVPISASAAVINLTVVDGSPGFWTVHGAGTPRPPTSNVNIAVVGQVVPNQAIVPVVNGSIDVFTASGGQFIVDVSGYFSGGNSGEGTDGLFISVDPLRALDTRGSLNPLGKGVKPGPGWTVSIPAAGRPGAPSSVSAVVVNTTMTAARGSGYVTAHPAGVRRPLVSNVNAGYVGHTIANHAVVPVSGEGMSLFTETGSHLIVDIAGYFTGPPQSATTTAYNPSWTPSFPGRIVIPGLGVNELIRDGLSDELVNMGPVHWPGTGGLGVPGNMAIFGHRVSHSAPFQNIDALRAGDSMFITVEDVTWRYEVSKTSIVLPNNIGVLNPPTGASTLTLIACHPPGSVAYRIVVEAVAVELIPLAP